MKALLYNILVKIVSDFSDTPVSIKLDIPSDLTHGDYTTNIALVLFKDVKDSYHSPKMLAKAIVERLKSSDDLKGVFEQIEVAGSGFINFHFNASYLVSRLDLITTKRETYGQGGDQAGKKVMVEFTDPNPFKEFHIGHVYSNTVGEAIARLYESQGAEVKRVCYQGDVGLHVAKVLWGLDKKMDNEKVNFSELSEWPENERVKFLGQAYALGSAAYEESKLAKQEIILLNKQVFEKDPSIMNVYEKGKEWSLDYFSKIYERLGMSYWKFYFESETGTTGKRIVEDHIGDVFVKSDGAVIFPGKNYGLHNRVFINSLGLPTYEAKELGLAPIKYDDFAYDESIIITGSEINAYFKVVLKALSLIRPELAEKTRHISHGMVRLPEGKMSSRTGNVITGMWLLDEARSRAEGLIADLKHDDMHIPDVSETVGVAAVKYAFLRASIGSDVEFDFDESVNFDGNSGPYILYSYVRTRSILKKAAKEGVAGEHETLNDEEKNLLRLLIRFPDIVAASASSLSPNTVATYLYDLASTFNFFYQKHKIVGVPQENLRLLLTDAVGQVLKNGLHILGIKTLERM